MPTIDVNYRELEHLLGIDLSGDMEKLDEIISYVKAEVKGFVEKENTITIEFKDTNRPDLWSVEGLSRALRGYLGQEKGIKKYSLGQSDVEVNVDAKIFDIRPYICCSVVRDIHLSDEVIKGIMHLQEKLDQTSGRNRQKTSIGIYNLDLIKPPIRYTAVKPSEVSFVPLGFNEKMNLDKVLERHPKGQEYGHIVKRHPLYPMLFDSEDHVLSFPPIINSNDLGKITEQSVNLFVEVTGTVYQSVLNTLNLVTLALIDRGGQACSVTVNYPDVYSLGSVVTPDFSSRTIELSVAETNRLLGLGLSSTEIASLLGTAGFDVERITGDCLSVVIPCYRVDVMHQVDLIEDVAIAYGYNNIVPLWRELPTTGKAKPGQRLINIARDLMVGLGYQETLNNTLTNQETLFKKMNVEPTKIVEIANPKVNTMTCLRNWLLPSLLAFSSVNQSVEFPQKIFELGIVTLLDETKETRTRDENWLAALTTHPNANFSEIKSALDSFMANFGVEWQIKATTHPSFMDGRVGEILVDGICMGYVGEIYLGVLEAWKLENPAAAFELRLQPLIDAKLAKKHC